VLEKEIERLGIPCALITSLIPAALTIGANRIIQGASITSPVGNPELSPSRERELRRDLVKKAIEVLKKKIDHTEVF